MMRYTKYIGEVNWHNAYPVAPNLDIEELIAVYKLMLECGGIKELDKTQYWHNEYWQYNSETDAIYDEALCFLRNYAIKPIEIYHPPTIQIMDYIDEDGQLIKNAEVELDYDEHNYTW